MLNIVLRSSAVAAGLVWSTGLVHAQEGSARRAVTTHAGSALHQEFGPGSGDGGGFQTRAALWTFTDAASVPATLAFSEGSGSLWVGEWLNFERVQRFDIQGDGTPSPEFSCPPASNTAVSAATAADLAAVLNNAGSAYSVTAYSKAAGFLWTFPFPSNLDNAYYNDIKVSRDGSTVACVLNDQTAAAPTLYILEGATGAVRHAWPLAAGFAGAVDVTDDGALALVTVNDQARLVDTATGSVLISPSASGSGGHHVISGNGNTFALGGFDFQVYTKVGSSYVRTVNTTAPTSWFGWAVAVSRDGSTVGVLSHNYGANYLQTTTRIFDAASGALLGSSSTTGTGSFQDSAAGASMSDNGAVLAVASWGTQNNSHPEVRVFDRTCTLIASLDTPGSPFWVDVSFDGRFVAVGSKAVHANTFGSGGRVNVFRTRCPADLNLDGFVDGIDYDLFNNNFEAGDLAADYNSDGFIDGLDYDGFNNAFESGGC